VSEEDAALPEHPDAPRPAPGTRPELTPRAEHYRIDLDLLPPSLDGASWQLPVGGLVEQPVTLRLAGGPRGPLARDS